MYSGRVPKSGKYIEAICYSRIHCPWRYVCVIGCCLGLHCIASRSGSTSHFVCQHTTDNEYQDCPNFNEGWRSWKRVFAGFHNRWDTPFRVRQDSNRPENFYFVHKRVLYIGLNIVGGSNDDAREWRDRLTYQWHWTKGLLNKFLPSRDAASVVIIGHADPREDDHKRFFGPLKDYIRNNSGTPFLYLNGDRHYFERNKNFYGQRNFHRIMVEGGRNERPLRMELSVPKTSNHGRLRVSDVYSYRR